MVINEDGIHSLILNSIGATDGGTYTCIAKNRGGEAKFDVQLSVLRKQLFHIHAALSNIIYSSLGWLIHYFIQESGMLTECIAHNCDLASGWFGICVIWHFDDLASAWLRHQCYLASRWTGICVIWHVDDVSDVSLCPTARPLSSTPRFVSRMTNQTVPEGAPVSFTVEVTGYPVPGVNWTRNGQMLHNDHRYNIQTVGGNSILSIKAATQDDNGWFQCTAANVAGTASNRMRLSVLPGSDCFYN